VKSDARRRGELTLPRIPCIPSLQLGYTALHHQERDLADTGAHAGIDSTPEGRAIHDALRAAIATRHGYRWWDVDHAG